MEDIELINLLAVYNKKIEESRVLNLQSWILNYKCFEGMQTQKVRSKLGRLMAIKIIAVILGIAWILFLGLLVYWNRLSNIYFSVSVVMIILFSCFAVAVYIKHIIMLTQIDYSESITNTQEKLSALQLSTINVIRILSLQLPFYSTWFWTTKWIMSGTLFWTIPFPITVVLTISAVWFYKNISPENIGNKKGRFLMSGVEFSYIVKAKDFLEEIEAFKKDILIPTEEPS